MKIATNQDQPQPGLQDPPPLKPQSVPFGNDGAGATPQPNRQEMSSATQPRIYAEAPALESTTTSAFKSFFNPPQRVNGQLGYPLGPTRPPRLRAGTTEQIPPPDAQVIANPRAESAHYSKLPSGIDQASVSTAAGTRSGFCDEPPVASTSRQASGEQWRLSTAPERSERAANGTHAPPRPLRGQDRPLPPPPSDRELFFYSKFKSIDDANRQLGHLKMDRNPAWLNMGTKEPYFGANKNSTIGPLSNEKNSPFMKRWQEVWGTEETKGKNLSKIWQALIKNQQINLKNYIDDQTMDLVLFNSKFHETISDPTKSMPQITPNTYRNELTARQDFKRDLYILQREALNDDSPIFKLDDRALKSLKKISFKWPLAGEGNAVTRLMPYRKNDDSIKYIEGRKAYYEDALYRYGNGDNSMQGVIRERSRLQSEFDNDVSGYFRDRQLKAQLEFWNWSKVNVAGGIVGFHLIDYLKKKYGA
ncbi:hypothetical protein [Paraburkholderia sp. BCC1876]|uniref:hypothetical protein n=1 Tax=Paraburkholderia sp. BCC1876 TaxID=2676303 RepID=UPI0015922D43|nr:hypothetical protein [Paraburkholderia sp. BCC1876]